LASSFGSFVQSGWVVSRAVTWIEAQRAANRPHAGRLPDEARQRLEPYFESATLEPVRVRTVERLRPPAGLGLLGQLPPFGIDFERVLGMTFADTIVVAEGPISDEVRLGNLFHECVHVAQYRQLGVQAFVRRYLAGWAAADYRYRAIPMERDAYDLQARFVSDPAVTFSVESEVSRRLAQA
jgi:hypothetical protein